MEENGVWRTVGGRRIFIKEGESLSNAMKNSNKFNDKKEVKKKVKKQFDEEENRLIKKYGKEMYDEEVQSVEQWKKDYGNDIKGLEEEIKQSTMYLDEDSEGYELAKKNISNAKKALKEMRK